MNETHARLLQSTPVPGLVPDRLRSARVLLAGLGNIGSYLAVLVAPLVSFIRLVDRGTVKARNTANQFYGPDVEGLTKVEATAALLRRLAPHVTVEGRVADLEDLTWGELADVDVALAGLDSLRARQVLSDKLVPLRIPLIDGGVGEPMLVRVQVLLPGRACLQCSWGPGQRRALSTEYRCGVERSVETPPTISPGCGGAVAAGMMVAQCARLFGPGPPQDSYEINGDLLAGRFVAARRHVNNNCRACRWLGDRAVPVLPLPQPPAVATVADLLSAAQRAADTDVFQLEFRRGILAANLFGDQVCAEPAQLHPIRHLRLAELGLTSSDRVVIHAGGRPHAAHIVLDTVVRSQT